MLIMMQFFIGTRIFLLREESSSMNYYVLSYLTSGETGISHGAADDKVAAGVDVEHGVLV